MISRYTKNAANRQDIDIKKNAVDCQDIQQMQLTHGINILLTRGVNVVLVGGLV